MQQFVLQFMQKGPASLLRTASMSSAMVVMCPRAQSPATAGPTNPVTSEASTQRELQKENAALQVRGCRECLWPLAKAGAAGDGFRAHRRCAVIKDLCHQVKELQEEVSSLHSIRDNEKEIDQIFSNALQLQEPRLPTVLKGGGSGRVCACLFGKWRLP